MTVEQYRALPDRPDVIEELRWGQVITVAFPKMKHAKLQSRLASLLRPKAERFGIVEIEVAFRALPEYELRRADVAFVSQRRWDETDDDDNLHGSPEIAVEILSPSNSNREIQLKATLCLGTGTREFWILDGNLQKLTVVTRDGSIEYKTGQRVPLPLFAGESLAVDDIFA